MSARFLARALLWLGVAGTAAAQPAVDGTCYAKFKGPPIDMQTIVIIDETTARSASAITDFKRVVEQAVTRHGQRFIIVSFAGLAPGQHLKRIDGFTLEAKVPPAQRGGVVIVDYRDSQACVAKRAAGLRKHIPEVVSAALPVHGDFQRSEIIWALHTTLREFAAPALKTRVVIYSDALQHGDAMSFYAGRQPRVIDAEAELHKVPKNLRGAPAVEMGDVSILWFGVLAQNEEPGTPARRAGYQDPEAMEQLQKFWTHLLTGWGVRKVQMGHTVLNPQLELEGPAPATRGDPLECRTLTAAARGEAR